MPDRHLSRARSALYSQRRAKQGLSKSARSNPGRRGLETAARGRRCLPQDGNNQRPAPLWPNISAGSDRAFQKQNAFIQE
jgi:hypothetical protein